MSKYVKKRVGDICSIRRGASPRPIDDWMSEEGVPWVKISDATKDDGRFISKTDGFIKPDGAKKSVEVWPGDLIISNSATPALPKIMNIHACIHDGWLLAENFNGVTRDYLYYQIKFLKKYLINQGNGSIFKNLKTEILRDFPIVIPVTHDGKPNEKEQDKLTSILINIENKIENNNKIISELESIAKTIYEYWFLQFDFPNEDGKPYKSSGGKMVWNEELKREIPEGWEVSQIEKLLGKYPKTTSVMRDDYKKGTIYPIIDQSQEYICGYTDDIDKVLHMESAIVFGDHTNIAKYVNFDFARGADGTQIVNSNNEAVSNYMLYLQICELPVIEQGYSRHFKFLKEQKVVVPRLEISKKYDSKIDAILTERRKCIQENRELVSLRDFLLPLLMNGQVTFKEES